MKLVIGGRYNWKNQPERLVYKGKLDIWHHFVLVGRPNRTWCEVLEESLHMLEETEVKGERSFVKQKPKRGA